MLQHKTYLLITTVIYTADQKRIVRSILFAVIVLGLVPVALAQPQIASIDGISRIVLHTQLVADNFPFDGMAAWYPAGDEGPLIGPGIIMQNGTTYEAGSILLSEYAPGVIEAAADSNAAALITYGIPNIISPADIPLVIISEQDTAAIRAVLGSGNATVSITYDRGTFEALSSTSDVDSITIRDRVYGVATGDDALLVFDLINPAAPVMVSSVSSDVAGFEALRGAGSVKTAIISGVPYAIVSGDGSVQIIDMSNPYRLVPASAMHDDTGGYPALGGAADIEVFESSSRTHIMIAAPDDDGIQIVDVTNPYEPRPTAAVFDDRQGFESLAGARAIAIGDINGRPYAVVAGYDDDYIQIIDIVNPYVPVPIPNTSTDTFPIDGAIDVEIVHDDEDTYAAILSYNENAIHILNVTEPFLPVLENVALDGNARFNALDRPWDLETITVSGRQQAVISSYGDDAIQLVDMNNPALPRSLADTIPDEDDDDEDIIILNGARGVEMVTISGTTYSLVASSLDDQVHILDVSRPASPTLVGSTFKMDDVDLALDGPGSVHITKINGKVYGMLASYALDSVQILNLTSGQVRPMVTLLDGVDGFEALDGPSAIDTITIQNRTYGIVTAYDDNGIQIINMTNPAQPVAIHEIFDGEDGFEALAGARGVSVQDVDGRVTAVVASYKDDAIQIVDLVNMQFPLPAGAVYQNEVYVDDDDLAADDDIKIQGLDGAWDVEIIQIQRSTYAIVSGINSDSVQILDITNPAYPWPEYNLYDGYRNFGALRGAGDIETAHISGSVYALVAAKWDNAIQIIDITRPWSPEFVSAIYDNTDGALALGGPNDIEVIKVLGSTYIIVASILDGALQMIDITDPYQPQGVFHVFDGDGDFEYLGGASDIETYVIAGRMYGIVTGVADDGMHLIEILP